MESLVRYLILLLQFMLKNSTEVSREITDLILSKAKQLHMDKIKNIALERQARTTASKYPEECGSHLIHFFNLPSSSSRTERLSLPYREPPQSPTQYGTFTYTQSSTPKTLLRGRSSRFLDRKVRGSHQPYSKKTQCVKLELSEKEDKQIEMMRQKKQRFYDLEELFIQSEQQERTKPKIERTKYTFTTDFNGQGLELNSAKKKLLGDSYFRTEVSVNIREVREENQRLPTEDSGMNKNKKENRASYRYGPLVSRRVLPKESRPSDVNMNYTIKDLQQQILKKQQKRKPKVKNSSEIPLKFFPFIDEL